MLYYHCMGDTIFVYITNYRCCLKLTSKRGYVIWQGKNILFTPAHDWAHRFIQHWYQKRYQYLMMSTVWLNLHQGIIAILSGGMTGQLRDLIQVNPTESVKPWLAPKGVGLISPQFTHIWGHRVWPSPIFLQSEPHPPQAPSNTGYTWS